MTGASAWRGCRLAASHADFWHGAHDFASTTLCGLRLAGSGMSEGRVTAAMRECPACARVAAEHAGHDHDAGNCPDLIRRRLEDIRASLRAEDVSYGELAELQSLAGHIEPGDTELLEAAGVPEFPGEPA